MSTYLVFHLYGPMASFGDTAVGEYRPTYAHPSKSVILGIVACAMGIRREEEDKLRRLNEGLGFGVLIISSGSLLRDYHTTQVPSAISVKRQPVSTRKDELRIKDQNTILSTRDYRMDAMYRVALWSTAGDLILKEIQKALLNPCFTPYLGRKSCPQAIPFQPELIESASAKEALTRTRHKLDGMIAFVNEGSRGRPEIDSSYLLYQDPEPDLNDNGLQINWRKDRLISRRNWQYGDRQEILMKIGGKDVLQ